MSCLLSDSGDAEHQFLFPVKIIILCYLGFDEMFKELDLIIEIIDMVLKDLSRYGRLFAALELVDVCLAGGIQIFQQACQGLKLTQFLPGRVPGRRGLCAAEISNDGYVKAIWFFAGQQAPGKSAYPGRVNQADKMFGDMQSFRHRKGILPRGFQADMHLFLTAMVLQPVD